MMGQEPQVDRDCESEHILGCGSVSRRAKIKLCSSQKWHPRRCHGYRLVVLTLLMFTKNAYGESSRSFYTFYLMERFGLSIP